MIVPTKPMHVYTPSEDDVNLVNDAIRNIVEQRSAKLYSFLRQCLCEHGYKLAFEEELIAFLKVNVSVDLNARHYDEGIETYYVHGVPFAYTKRITTMSINGCTINETFHLIPPK